ncbi:MAG: hypothetical protein LC808_12695 [Actinobacteria bacterium]|nr:hypothetical protein [Actinomycetota bacterium]
MLVLDSGAVSHLTARSPAALATIQVFSRRGLWPPTVPTVVLVESLTGHPGRDATTNKFLKGCRIEPAPSEVLARRAALLRTVAGQGSAVDAVVIAAAEPGGTALTSDPHDLCALAGHARAVRVVTL